MVKFFDFPEAIDMLPTLSTSYLHLPGMPSKTRSRKRANLGNVPLACIRSSPWRSPGNRAGRGT